MGRAGRSGGVTCGPLFREDAHDKAAASVRRTLPRGEAVVRTRVAKLESDSELANIACTNAGVEFSVHGDFGGELVGAIDEKVCFTLTGLE